MKEYSTPEIELIEFSSEAIAGDEILDTETGLETSVNVGRG